MRRRGRWLCVLLATVPLAVAARQNAEPERGERIVNERCTSCHDLRLIEVQALDVDGWTNSVKAEITRGAKLGPDETAILIGYLVKFHGPVPDGPGKAILLNTCTLCHDLQRVRRQQSTAEGWAETLDAMLNEGAPLTEKDFPVLLRYLARNFGPVR